MKKYADKILIFILITFFVCIIAEAPFMTEAYLAEIKKREEDSKKHYKEWLEKTKQQIENETEAEK